jgi:hypothetical protein
MLIDDCMRRTRKEAHHVSCLDEGMPEDDDHLDGRILIVKNELLIELIEYIGVKMILLYRFIITFSHKDKRNNRKAHVE